MTYSECVAWLETRHMMPLLAPGLERTKSALQASGLLTGDYKKHTIHIAGTNGKGTTARALEHLLLASGETVGLFTSPHLVSTCERLRANGKMISENQFRDLCLKHRDTIIKFHLTHFEALTLFALDYFLNIAKTKWMIFEIGLGGLWDSTNAIPHDTSVITTIGFDHMHILGNSLTEIAKNKFGIIHKRNTVLHQHYPEEVEALLDRTISEQQANRQKVDILSFSVKKELIPEYSLLFKGQQIPLTIPGERAVSNLSTAIATFLKLGFSEKHVTSLSTLSWPARMTKLHVPEAVCPVYISGDHNIQGLESLIELLLKSTYKNIKIILGLSKHRSHEDFVERLKTLRDAKLFYTQPTFQGVSPNEQQFAPFFPEPQKALLAALAEADASDLIVITGSLYLCGDYLKLYQS